MVEISIIIPTYNESENIALLIEKISEIMGKTGRSFEIIVVDDGSIDGTRQIVEKMERSGYNVKLVAREKREGVTSAVLDGVSVASGDIIVVMDADFSHPPEALPVLLEPILEGSTEFVIGSRYIKGGKITGWPLKRKIISYSAKLLARPFTGIKDPLSGFMAFRRSVIEGARINPVGNKICLELIAKGNYGTVKEVPYEFRDRVKGRSKMNLGVILDYLIQLIRLTFARRSKIGSFFRFLLVGAFGAAINLILLYVFTDGLKINHIISGILSSFIAMVCNYSLNRNWTFGCKGECPKHEIFMFSKSVVVSLIGIVITVVLYYIAVDIIGIWYILGMAIAIVITALWNYFGNKLWTFRHSHVNICYAGSGSDA